MREWLDEDEHALKRMYLIERMRAPDIAKVLGRGVGAVRMKISKLNLANCDKNDFQTNACM